MSYAKEMIEATKGGRGAMDGLIENMTEAEINEAIIEIMQPPMTLRQHFAGLAMQGVILAMSDDKVRCLIIENASENGIAEKEQVAFASVEYADALLAELSKETP